MRKPLALSAAGPYRKPAGAFVESGTIGSVVFVRTTAVLLLVHVGNVPVITCAAALRIRELARAGDHTNVELANLFDVSETIVQDAIDGTQRTIRHLHLPRVFNERTRIAAGHPARQTLERRRKREARMRNQEGTR